MQIINSIHGAKGFRAICCCAAAIALTALSCNPNDNPDDPKKQEETRLPSEAVVGEKLPAWAEGWLDIHAISTGRGECTFFIMPDGTSMMIDAGEIVTSTSSPVSVVQRPNADTRPYFTQSRYMKHFLEATGHSYLDYAVMSHFHIDHFGTPHGKGYTKSSEGYTQTGMMAIFTTLPYKKLIDRAWSKDDPEYEFVKNSSKEYSTGMFGDYTEFVKYATGKKGLVMERFQAGTDRQLTLCYNAAKYPSFKIFNYGVNGEYWSGSAMVDAYGSGIPYENGTSCISLISYGKFDYYTAGDAGGNTNMAVPVAKVIGRPVEAMKADHHMSVNCLPHGQMSILQPRVIVTQSFAQRTDQPMLSTVEALLDHKYYSSDVSLYFTCIDPVISTPNANLYDRCHINGHVVIRVAPGGDEFWVFQLDDTNNFYKVKSIEGPIECK
ncbi:MAG: hypothetical protein IKX67_09610 [Bacteroidales bacterium]|nr:hypothetical protein [Bacteroidales bacterium]